MDTDTPPETEEDISVDESPVEYAIREAWNQYADLPDEFHSEKQAMAEGWNSAMQFVYDKLADVAPEVAKVILENFKYHGTMGV